MTTIDPATFDALTLGDQVVAAYPERVKGRTFLITGPSAKSIGFTTATALAKAGPAILILVGRSTERLAPARDAVLAIDPSIIVVLAEADLSSMASVRAGAETILRDERVKHIDVMINNAAIMAGPEEKSVDGIEMQFATNHIGHFLLTLLLAEKLRKSPEGGQIVNVASSGHRKVHFKSVEEYDPLFERHPYKQWDAYGNAKLANILFTKGLVARGFRSLVVHPGSIVTGLGDRIKGEWQSSQIEYAGIGDMEPILPIKTQEQGPNTQLRAALDPSLPNGVYMFQCQVSQPSVFARDENGVLTQKLWEVSERLVGQKFE